MPDMTQHTRPQQLTQEAPAAELSPLDAIIRAAVRRKPVAVPPTPAPALAPGLDALVAATRAGRTAQPVAQPVDNRPVIGSAWKQTAAPVRRDERPVIGTWQQTKQDADVQCQGGLFGSVDESTEPVRDLHGSQIPFGAVETDRGSGCCICGDRKCGIGPFVMAGGAR